MKMKIKDLKERSEKLHKEIKNLGKIVPQYDYFDLIIKDTQDEHEIRTKLIQIFVKYQVGSFIIKVKKEGEVVSLNKK